MTTTRYSQAETLALEIAAAKTRGEFPYTIEQMIKTMDDLVGAYDSAQRFVWPAAIAAIADEPAQR